MSSTRSFFGHRTPCSPEKILSAVSDAFVDPDTAEVSWEYAPLADVYGVYPYLPDKSTALGAYILPEGREAISGSRFMIFRTKPAMRFMNASNWQNASGVGRTYPS